VLTRPPERPAKPDPGLHKGLQYAALGTEVSLTVAGAAWLGWWLDKALGSGPWLLLAMVLLGTAVAMLRLFRLASALQRQEEREERTTDAGDEDERPGTDSEGVK